MGELVIVNAELFNLDPFQRWGLRQFLELEGRKIPAHVFVDMLWGGVGGYSYRILFVPASYLATRSALHRILMNQLRSPILLVQKLGFEADEAPMEGVALAWVRAGQKSLICIINHHAWRVLSSCLFSLLFVEFTQKSHPGESLQARFFNQATGVATANSLKALYHAATGPLRDEHEVKTKSEKLHPDQAP